MMFALPPAVVAGELVRLQTRQHVVALTFDGGGNAAGARGVLALLRRENVNATFFLTGHFVKTYPALARTIGRRYPVGNHTVNHLDLRRLSTAGVTREIAQAETMIRNATGRDPRPYFRFPTARGTRARSALRIGWATLRCAGRSTRGDGWGRPGKACRARCVASPTTSCPARSSSCTWARRVTTVRSTRTRYPP
jgi:peptidoglycan/xylan/chitin deacetylase (PgdA/CDA1 family)